MQRAACRIVLLTCISLGLLYCDSKEKPRVEAPTSPRPQGQVKIVRSHTDISSLRASHAGKCGDMPLASLEAYEEIVELSRWIENKRGVSFQIPPICVPDEKTFLELLNYPADESYNEKVLELNKAIGFAGFDDELVGYGQEDAPARVQGFYLPDKNIMVVNEEDFSKDVVVHELVHAMQYQHAFVNKPSQSSHPLSKDEWSVSNNALEEGEAALIREIFIWENEKGRKPDLKEMARQIREKFFADIKNERPLQAYDRYLKYDLGRYFIFTKMANGYDPGVMPELYNNPPVSSEQVIVPEKYERNEMGLRPADFDVRAFNRFFEEYGYEQRDDVIYSLGRLGLIALMKTYERSDAKMKPFEVAKGWDGDRTLVYAPSEENGTFDARKSIFIHLAKWDSERDAQAFIKDAAGMLMNKYAGSKLERKDFSNKMHLIFRYEEGPVHVNLESEYDRTFIAERIPDELLDDFLERNAGMLFDFVK